MGYFEPFQAELGQHDYSENGFISLFEKETSLFSLSVPNAFCTLPVLRLSDVFQQDRISNTFTVNHESLICLRHNAKQGSEIKTCDISKRLGKINSLIKRSRL